MVFLKQLTFAQLLKDRAVYGALGIGLLLNFSKRCCLTF